MISSKQKKKLKRKVAKRARIYDPAYQGKQLTEIKFHKGYVYDKIQYSVLTAGQLSETDRNTIQATLKMVTTGAEALTIAEKDNWACEQLGFSERAFLLKYRGIEVALVFKRQLTVIKPEPGERVPDGVLQDPADAWQRLDLMGSSAKRSAIVTKNTHERLSEENELLKTRVQALDDLNFTLEKDNQNWIEKYKKQVRQNGELRKAATSKASSAPKRRVLADPISTKKRSTGTAERQKRKKK